MTEKKDVINVAAAGDGVTDDSANIQAAINAAPVKKVITEAEMEQITKSTAQMLKEQEQVKVRLYLPQEERKKLEAAKENGLKVEWPFEFVSINGHNYQIQKGIDVIVPLSIKEILEEAGLI